MTRSALLQREHPSSHHRTPVTPLVRSPCRPLSVELISDDPRPPERRSRRTPASFVAHHRANSPHHRSPLCSCQLPLDPETSARIAYPFRVCTRCTVDLWSTGPRRPCTRSTAFPILFLFLLFPGKWQVCELTPEVLLICTHMIVCLVVLTS